MITSAKKAQQYMLFKNKRTNLLNFNEPRGHTNTTIIDFVCLFVYALNGKSFSAARILHPPRSAGVSHLRGGSFKRGSFRTVTAHFTTASTVSAADLCSEEVRQIKQEITHSSSGLQGTGSSGSPMATAGPVPPGVPTEGAGLGDNLSTHGSTEKLNSSAVNRILMEFLLYIGRAFLLFYPVYLTGYLGLSISWVLLCMMMVTWWKKNRQWKDTRIGTAIDFVDNETHVINKELRNALQMASWVCMLLICDQHSSTEQLKSRSVCGHWYVITGQPQCVCVCVKHTVGHQVTLTVDLTTMGSICMTCQTEAEPPTLRNVLSQSNVLLFFRIFRLLHI